MNSFKKCLALALLISSAGFGWAESEYTLPEPAQTPVFNWPLLRENKGPVLIVSGIAVVGGLGFSAYSLTRGWQNAALGFNHPAVQTEIAGAFAGLLISAFFTLTWQSACAE